jgi:hypothetical protein
MVVGEVRLLPREPLEWQLRRSMTMLNKTNRDNNKPLTTKPTVSVDVSFYTLMDGSKVYAVYVNGTGVSGSVDCETLDHAERLASALRDAINTHTMEYAG